MSLVPLISFSKETEPFRCRTKIKKARSDFKKLGNQYVQSKLKIIEEEFSGKSCTDSIIEAFRDEIYGGLLSLKGGVEAYADELIEKDRKKKKLGFWCKQQSYNTIYFKRVPLATAFITPSINLCGQQVGTDKLGHFFNNSYELYAEYNGEWLRAPLRFYVKLFSPQVTCPGKAPLDKALCYSLSTEMGEYGAKWTSVVSYADSAVNYYGLTFWQNFYDPTGENPKAYFQCKNGKIKRTKRKFNWCDYVTPLWDEAINCSRIAQKNRSGDIIRYLSMTELMHQSPMYKRQQCPVSTNECIRGVSHLKKTMGTNYSYSRAKLLVDESCLKYSIKNKENPSHNIKTRGAR
ncbi:MAG: hypothetical protein D6797_01650 [Bdellovibrio sp.]|nr:MAG: hypothetical protein D6797_01650 [Bdellovibrio sp.]